MYRILQGISATFGIGAVILMIGAAFFWVSNIVQLIMQADVAIINGLTLMIVLKIVGIFMAPLGAIMGFIGYFA